MSPAETMTAAADKLEKLLADTSSGPWVAHPDGLVWAQRPGDPVSGSSDVADADYIGRALVVLLRAEAEIAAVDTRLFGATTTASDAGDAALALARAILGEVAS